ncbi:MAG: hypothetical protein ABR573_04585 [Candidatus Dormibacteria bacterium]
MTATTASPGSAPSFVVPELDLQRKMFVAEYRLTVLLSTLPPLVPVLAAKYDLARMGYEDATHADALRHRMAQMRGGATRKEPEMDPGLDAVFEAALRAPSLAALLGGAFSVLKADMVRAYSTYLDSTHPLGDQPTILLIESALHQERAHLEDGVAMAEAQQPTAADRDWVEYLARRLRAAGGIDGTLSGPPVTDDPAPELVPWEMPLFPAWGSHPLGFSLSLGEPSPEKDLLPFAFEPDADLRLVRAGMYTWLFHEVDVLDYLPRMFRETKGMPFEFHLDLARHQWDEARHSAGGHRGLARIGCDPNYSVHPIALRLGTANLNPVELYASMTQLFEAGSFAPKADLIRRLDQLNDADLSSFLRYDRADETTHVAFGTKWVPRLAEHFGMPGTMAELVEHSKGRFEKVMTDAQAAHTIPWTVPPEKAHSYNNLARMWGIPTRES